MDVAAFGFIIGMSFGIAITLLVVFLILKIAERK